MIRFTAATWRSPALMVLSGCSLYLGAALAVKLFHRFDPATLAWLRVAVAGVLLLLWARPQVARWTRTDWFAAILYGLSTLAMNIAFYEAIARIPMGLVVAIEFLGPIVIALIGVRGPRDFWATVAAGGGVLLISGARLVVNPVGLAWAIGAAAMWACYILASHRLSTSGAERGDTSAQMAVGFSIAALAYAPIAVAGGTWPNLGESTPASALATIAAVIAMGVLSTLIPYRLDQVILRLSGRATFALLLAILPLTAAAIGLITLGQLLSLTEIAGVALIVAAIVIQSRPGRPPALPIQN